MIELIDIMYSWKGAEYKELITLPVTYAEWEMSKYENLYSIEYKFKLK
jgi:hypothetical protein